jgi:hypothetical protein
VPARPLPPDPSLEHLRRQAKRLRRGVRDRDAGALAEVREFHPRGEAAIAAFTLADAQVTTARACGFASWAQLKTHLRDIESVTWTPPPADRGGRVDAFVRLACPGRRDRAVPARRADGV